MTREWIYLRAVIALMALVLVGSLVLKAGHPETLIGSHPSPPSRTPSVRAITVKDTLRPWTASWVTAGLPSTLQHQGGIPWVVADPSQPSRTWWLWPTVSHGALWMGTSEGSEIRWYPWKIGKAPPPAWPEPFRQSYAWVRTLETGHGSVPTTRVEPLGAFMEDIGTVTGIAGWAATMQPTARTIVLTWELTRSGHHGIRLISEWQWRKGWECQLIVLEREPKAGQVPVPPAQGIPPWLPGWARGQ